MTPICHPPGSEGRGVRPLVEQQCDIRLSIAIRASPLVDSLNVSVAAGLLLHHLTLNARTTR
jgi:tRNA G18 (ribose-2'-O)-methylase SpoU